MLGFKEWSERYSSIFELENQIIEEKIAEGINGIEWLVIQMNLTSNKLSSLDRWTKFLAEFKLDKFQVMMDALTIHDPDQFYEKHKINWWISIGETLTYLTVLKNRNYENYFDFLQDVAKELKNP